MNTFFNTYLICAILGLILYPGFWNKDFAIFANNLNSYRKNEEIRYEAKNYYIGWLFFLLIPVINIVFSFLSLIALLQYNKWKKRHKY